MLLYIVRHGKPDYATNTLVEEGRRQAVLVADRLEKVGIDAIYSSPYGRAVETAQPLADRLNLPIQIEDWAYELGDESRYQLPDGTRILLAKLHGIYYHQEKFRALSVEESFDRVEAFSESFKERYHSIAAGLDDLLARNGFKRNDAGFYDPIAANDRRIALFCHAGMERVLISHLFHLPYQFLATSMQVHFTSVTTIFFKNKPDDPTNVMPILYTLGDIGHLYNGETMPVHYVSGKNI